MTRFAALALSCFAAGGGAGLSGDVRTDISARMTSAQQPIQACYAEALKTNRKLRGTMVLTFAAAPSTGAFTEISVARDDLGDPKLQQCVTGEVGKLKLEKPQSTRIAVSGYPLDFQPSN
jgi:hypothetical protein